MCRDLTRAVPRTWYHLPLVFFVLVSKLPSTGSYCSRKKMTTYTRTYNVNDLVELNKKELYFF